MSVDPGSPRHRPPAFAATSILFALVLLTTMILFALPAQALVPPLNPDEPNDSFATATALTEGETTWGAIPEATDKDYFYIDLPESADVKVEFTTGVLGRVCELAFLPTGSDVVSHLTWEKNYDDDGSFFSEGIIGPGRLFAIVSAGSAAPGVAVYTITISYEEAGDVSFPDVPAGSEYYGAITYLADEGVVSGYPNGKFGTYDLVTRQQFAKMVVRAVGYAVFTSDVCPFSDVTLSYPGHYVDPNDSLYPDHYVAVAAEHHITLGLTASVFGPYQNIKMAQVTTMVVRTATDLGLWDAPAHSYTPPFEDFGEPHYEYARMGAAHGLFEGYPGPWDWFAPATRGQCAFFIWKLMVAYHGGVEPHIVY
jgi:hypothetical protein